jgi:hypothetical protein
MAKEKFIGQRGQSEDDPGLVAMRARVAAQQDKAKAESEDDPGLEAMQARVAAQRAGVPAAPVVPAKKAGRKGKKG